MIKIIIGIVLILLLVTGAYRYLSRLEVEDIEKLLDSAPALAVIFFAAAAIITFVILAF